MAIAHRAAARSETGHGTVTSGSHNATKPAGVVAGDVLVATYLVYRNTTNPAVISVPSGWTICGRYRYGGNYRAVVCWKVAGGSEPASYGFSWTSGTNADTSSVALLTAYSGAHATDPVAHCSIEQVRDVGQTNVNFPVGYDGFGTDSLSVLMSVASMAGSGSATPPTGWTERHDSVWNPGSTQYHAFAADKALTGAAGAVAVPTASVTNQVTGVLAHLVLRDAGRAKAPAPYLRSYSFGGSLTEYYDGTSQKTINVPMPYTAAGDVVVAVCDFSETDAAWTTPSGWTLLTSMTFAPPGDSRFIFWTTGALGTAAALTFARTAGNLFGYTAVSVYVIGGAVPEAPVHASSSGTDSTAESSAVTAQGFALQAIYVGGTNATGAWTHGGGFAKVLDGNPPNVTSDTSTGGTQNQSVHGAAQPVSGSVAASATAAGNISWGATVFGFETNNIAPTAPTLTPLESVSKNSPIPFDWTHNDADGDPQAGFALVRKRVAAV